MKSLEYNVCSAPKAELHIHIEGTLEPALMFKLAKRNGISLRFKNVAAVREAYKFTNLQSFLDIYYEGCRVLVEEEDFYELAMAYFRRVAKQNVRHVELFFDPQSHTERGVAFETVVTGLHRAICDARKELGISAHLIMCFLRHLSADEAMKTLLAAVPFKHMIVAVGLDSSEKGHPPKKFQEVFELALSLGFLTVAHAGEEGPAGYIWEALELLKVSRVDHGVRCVDDPALMRHLAHTRTPLTMCPWSSLRLCVVKSLEAYPLKLLLDNGLCVSVHSDDPAYFGKYINDCYRASQKAFGLSIVDLAQLARNSFEGSFLPAAQKRLYIAEVDSFISSVGEVEAVGARRKARSSRR